MATFERIIPAYAGNFEERMTELLGNKDHPRLRGELTLTAGFSNKMLGSSPPTRGTWCTHGEAVRKTGIIPAYAGNLLKIPEHFNVSIWQTRFFNELIL